MWLNFAFIFSGVFAGIALGALVPSRPAAQAFVLRALFALAAAALVTTELLILYLDAARLSDV